MSETTIRPDMTPETAVAALRQQLVKDGLDGFLVPMADEYQSEYVPASAQRIAFLSAFTGSAGYIIVLRDKAAFFTDGRYTLQAEQQIPAGLFVIHDSADKTPSAWLSDNLDSGMKLGFDPWLHTASEVERLKKVLEKSKSVLCAVDQNPIDAIWANRPAAPMAKIFPHGLNYAGKSAADKRLEIGAELKAKNLSAAVITDPASTAWLLNIRGGDIPHTPLPLSFTILHDNGHVEWFVDARKVTNEIISHLGNEVAVATLNDFPIALDALASSINPVRIDTSESAAWIVMRLKNKGVKLDDGEDLTSLPRACKNATELEGARAAHHRDAVALVKFLAWLDWNIGAGDITEMAAAERLEAFRAESPWFRGPSFNTISGAGSHGAIVHYHATPTTNRRLEYGQIYLLDSGGQYVDGTTDVTRTIMLGNSNPEMRDRFTRVLKGHIALAAVRFPEGTTGGEIDVLARQFLWQAGLDFSHGTGHGVGSYLGVHEGPQGISRRSRVPLRAGMVLSNEPGYYKNGHYGIRIENLQVVTGASPILGGERAMMGFDPLTYVPIDRRLIEPGLLTSDERGWLNAYHAKVKELVHKMLDDATREWLELATEPL